MNKPQEELVLSKGKTTVYIPLQVVTLIGPLVAHNVHELHPKEIEDGKPINFELIANKLTLQNEESAQQVGVNAKEVLEIVAQHSWEKRHVAIYAVKAELSLEDVNLTRTSEHGPNQDTFFSIKQGTIINPDQIVSIEPVRQTPNYKHKIGLNITSKLVENAGAANSTEREKIIPAFLKNEAQWKPLVRGALNFSSFPKGIREMQAHTGDLAKLKEIARNELNGQSGFFSTKEDVATLDFYKNVVRSRSLGDLATWIKSHQYKDVTLKGSATPG